MDLRKVLSFPPYPGDYLHPVVYACTAVMLLCLLVSIGTYMVHHSAIRINRNGWHILLNFLFHTALTFGVFASGINWINLPIVCQIVGMVLHYASLSTILWLVLTARNLCNDVSKDPLRAQDRNGLAQSHNKPSILRFYVIGDGIPLIIVGVTAAFSLDNYGSRDGALFCWMAWEPSLGGFYAPLAFLVFVMSLYFLCTYIQLKRHPQRKYELQLLSEEQQQLPSSNSNHLCHLDSGAVTGSVRDCPPFAPSVSVLANEHSFKSQLCATAFTLFLVVATWASGGLAVSLGHFLDMIFSCLYGAFCVSLGLFLLIQHCAKRDDVWHRWWACCSTRSKKKDRDGSGHSRTQGDHQPNFHLGSPYSGKELSPHGMQSSYHKTPPPQSPTTNHTGPCCVAVLSPITEPMPSPRPQSIHDELPRPILPLQSCLIDRKKSHSFNRPRPCLQDFRSHMMSSSMDGSVQSSYMESPVHLLQGCNSSHPELQLPCLSPHLDKQMSSCQNMQSQTSCHSVQDSIASRHSRSHNMYDSTTSCHSIHLPSQAIHPCQWPMCNSADPSTSSMSCCCDQPDPFTLHYQQDPCMSRTAGKEMHTLCVDMEQTPFPRNTLPRRHAGINPRGTIARNRSLQEDNLFGSESTRSIRTGPWKNETSV